MNQRPHLISNGSSWYLSHVVPINYGKLVKINKIFIIAMFYAGLTLLSLNFNILFSESTVDWIFSDIILGFYLYFGYLILSMLYGADNNQLSYKP